MEGSIKRRERESHRQIEKNSLWRGKKKEEACLKFLLELLFDRITKDETVNVPPGRALIGRNLCKSASDVID